MAPKKGKGKGKGKKKKAQQQRTEAPSDGGGPSSAAAPGLAAPEPGDRGELRDLHSRPDLNGRRVEVREQVVGQDGAPRLSVRLLFGAGAGTVMKVKAANLKLDGAATEPEAGDTAELVGLRGRADLNGRRVEVEAQTVGKDGALRLLVRVLDNSGGEVVKVRAANLKPPAETEGLGALVEALQAMDPDRRDWAGGLPKEVLAKVVGKLVEQTEAAWVARVAAGEESFRVVTEEEIQEMLAKRKRDGSCLFVFAMVCKEWRKAQLKVGGPMCTRAQSDVILPGRVALVKWALAEGCPREHEDRDMVEVANMIGVAAKHGHLELVQWLVQEQGWGKAAKDVVMHTAAGGNLEVVQWLKTKGCTWGEFTCMAAATFGKLEILQWLRANGCPWDELTCENAVRNYHVEVLRWARENGCPWDAETQYRAAEELGYTDDFGNVV